MRDLLHSFPSQGSNEPVYVFARPYWLVFAPNVLIFLFLFLTSLAVQYASGSGALGISASMSNTLILFLGGFQLMALLVIFVAILDFYFDLVIVTDRNLVEIDQEQLFYRKIAQLNLEDVEDVSSVSKGFLQTFFDLGTIVVQTAGTLENFELKDLRFAAEIAAIISSLSDLAKAGVPDAQRVPESSFVGVIENKPYTDLEKLIARGAMLPSDIRRVKRQPLTPATPAASTPPPTDAP